MLAAADLQLHSPRPVPLGEPLVVRGELGRARDRAFHAAGRTESDAGEAMTLAAARWRRADPSSQERPGGKRR